MYKFKVLLSSFLFTFTLFSQNKSQYDLESSNVGINMPLSLETQSISFSNDRIGVTLLKDGYFTIGTNKGISTSSLDDTCQISFGHPYAMTSYPYFRINGINYYLENYLFGQTVNLEQSQDTLRLTAEEDSDIGIIFYLISSDSGAKLKIVLKLINKNTQSANLSAGIIFDPALGKWGDGFIFQNGELIHNSITYQSLIPEQLDIWERSSSPKGLGISLSFMEELPDRVDIHNWFNFRDNNLENSQLYDAALNFEKSLFISPWDTLSLTINIVLNQPEFPSGIFLRSNLPQFLSIENNLLFPEENIVLTEIYNNSPTFFPNLRLNLSGGEYVDNFESPTAFQVNPGVKEYKNVTVISHEIFENIITPLNLTILNNNQVQDNLLRNLFIPEAPFSDTGLVVEIDTIIINSPHVKLGFKAIRQDNNIRLTSLRKTNIFLFEDQQRLYNFTLEKDTSGGGNQADIIFILDVTGSMSEEIEGVKNNIVEFTDSLSRLGINFRLGMVTFLDEIENIYNFTSDVQQFQQYINQQFAHGGGDREENSLEALMEAAQFNFRPSANRIFIWITDADFHINNSFTNLTIQDVVNDLLSKSIVTHCIGDLQFQTQFYDPVVLPTGGNVYNIYGNFRDILLQISRLKEIGKYLIEYNSIGIPGFHTVKLEVHFAGLGGSSTINYNGVMGNEITNSEIEGVICYPNPFNPETNIYLQNPGLYGGEVNIYNILGQKVKTFSFGTGQNPIILKWNASNNSHLPISNGIYFVQASYFNSEKGSRSLPVQKLIYIK